MVVPPIGGGAVGPGVGPGLGSGCCDPKKPRRTNSPTTERTSIPPTTLPMSAGSGSPERGASLGGLGGPGGLGAPAAATGDGAVTTAVLVARACGSAAPASVG